MPCGLLCEGLSEGRQASHLVAACRADDYVVNDASKVLDDAAEVL